MKQIARPWALWLVLATLSCTPAVSAQSNKGDASSTAYRGAPSAPEPTASTPPAGPTHVAISAELLNLERVPEASDPEPNFDASFWVEMRWSDPRLAFDGQQNHHFVEEDAQAELGRIWDPEIVIDDQNGQREPQTVSLTIAPNGTVTYQEEFKSKIAAPFDLRAYPFDTQHFTLAILPDWSDQEAVFEIMPTTRAGQPGHPSEWGLMPSQMRIESRIDPDGSTRSTFVLDTPARRDGTFYILKLILPLLFVVALSWSNFWITGKGDGRIRLTFLCLLAVVAYQTVLSRFLPRLTFLTFLDWVVLLAQISLAATVVENAWVHQLLLKDKAAKADRIDHWARRLIPAVITFAVLIVAAVDFL
jgi:Neurotransmitter-gated ion-channel ligand binding domain